MRKTTLLFFTLLLTALSACSGSETYRGDWKAQDAEGHKFTISFEPKAFSVKDESGKRTKYEYSQNSVSMQNSRTTYGIQLEDGRKYLLVFPNSEDETVGLITDEDGKFMYAIGRKDYVSDRDIYKLEP